MMNIKNKKCVMIIDETLPLGLIANTSAIMGITLGKEIPEVIGEDVLDKDKHVHLGIIEFPIPILKGNQSLIKILYQKVNYLNNENIFVVDFSTLAQKCKTYDEYIEKMKMTKEEDLNYIGIALYGDKKVINKLTGSLPLLR